MDTGVHEPITGYPVKAIRVQADPNKRRDLIVRVVIPVIALGVLIGLLASCSHGMSTAEAVKLCQDNLAVIHATESHTFAMHERAAELAVERCREELGPSSSSSQREHCLAQWDMDPHRVYARYEALVEVGAAYDQIVLALGIIELHLPVLIEAREAATRALGPYPDEGESQ